MCMVEDGLRDGLKRVKAVQTSPPSCTLYTRQRSPFSQMSVHRPDSKFPGDGRPDLGQPAGSPECAEWV